jgi:ABC-type transport system involved in cytochrome c biogenesis permease subunit
MVGIAQIVLLLMAVASYLAGGAISLLAMSGRKPAPHLRWMFLTAGIVLSLALLFWHSTTVITQTGAWQPLQDSLSALVTLSILLAGFVAYVQLKRPIASLEWLMMPVVVVLLLMAGHFGKTQPTAYLPSAYSLVHRLFTFLGALAFVVAGAAGALYLMSDRMLRARPAGGVHLPPSPGKFGSLERLENLAHSAVTWGFAMFTLGILSGISWAVHEHGTSKLGQAWYFTPKVVLTMAVWVVFAVVLNTPIAPRLRGRKSAILSIVGLLLTIATLFAALLMPSAGGGGQ